MSLSGAMNVAVTGINAQSHALGNISDNIANVSTSGYKRVDTSFASLVTVATANSHEPGGVISRPLYMNDVQGTIQSTNVGTNLALNGEGMFSVSQKIGVATAGGRPTFAVDPFYTRAGDFSLDSQGYLVNASGYYLNGWSVEPSTGIVQKNATAPIQVTQLKDNPQATQSIQLSANLPTEPNLNGGTTATMQPQAVTIYDAQGTGHLINLNWTYDSTQANPWSLGVTMGGAAVPLTDPNTPSSTANELRIGFYTENDAVAGTHAGSVRSVGTYDSSGAAQPIPPASIELTLTLPNGNTQSVTLNLGTFGVAQQLTNFTGTDLEFNSATQDGLPPGSFRDLTIDSDGMVTLNYSNGNKKTFFQIPVAQFANYNGLQAEAGNAYAASPASGPVSLLSPGSNGTGSVQASRVEGSNVDISAELVKMIQTQTAYNASSRVISIANEMLRTIEEMAR